MKHFRRPFGMLLFAALVCIDPARATSWSTDQSDIWNALGEPGWAAEFVQRGSAIVAVIYVYDQSGNPVWYSATLEWLDNDTTRWGGFLYQTQGPWFAVTPFDPSQVSMRKVGEMLWTPNLADPTASTGRLEYDVDGVQVTKTLQRYLARYDDFSGDYQGGMHRGPCVANPSANDFVAAFNVAQNGLSISIQETDSVGSCLYSGQLSQAGQMGSVQGAFLCTDGRAGMFSFYTVQVNVYGITGAFFENYSNPAGCSDGGWFGGVRKRAFIVPQ
jgi:hypothetical protein